MNKKGRHANKYSAQRAQAKVKKRHLAKPKRCDLQDWHLEYIREKMKKEKWSPELICERGKMEYGEFISHTIYKYIWMCKYSNRKEHKKDKRLHTYLKHDKRRQKRKNRKGNRGCIPNRAPISKRPSIVNKRKRNGDLEVDLMMGANHKPGLIVITDRRTIETKLIKLNSKKASIVAKKIIDKMKEEKSSIYTLTFDNDLAFTEHQKIAKILNVKTYFTRPYTSQDKGSVENRIGVIRRFFPKGTDMSKIHHSTIKSVKRKINRFSSANCVTC